MTKDFKKRSNFKKGTVSFVDIDDVKRKAVRGLHKKRAKQYDSDSDEEARQVRKEKLMQADARSGKAAFEKPKKKSTVQKSSFQEAFASIMKGDGAAPKFLEDKNVDSKSAGSEDKKSSASKVISGPASVGQQPILSRYKKPANLVREEKAKE